MDFQAGVADLDAQWQCATQGSAGLCRGQSAGGRRRAIVVDLTSGCLVVGERLCGAGQGRQAVAVAVARVLLSGSFGATERGTKGACPNDDHDDACAAPLLHPSPLPLKGFARILSPRCPTTSPRTSFPTRLHSHPDRAEKNLQRLQSCRRRGGVQCDYRT